MRLVVGSIPTRGNQIFKFIISFCALTSRHSTVLSSATQHAIPSEFSEKWGKECLYTRFSLPTLLCAGYSVKLRINKDRY